MGPRVARIVAVVICALCLATTAASIPIGVAARERIQPGEIVIVGDPTTPEMRSARAELEREREAGDALQETTQGFNPVFGAIVVLLMLWLGVGLLIVWRQPRNWAGWLFLITGAPLPLLTLVQALTIYGAKADPGSVPLLGLWATIGEYLIYPIALLPLLFLLFPDGHPPSRRWRWAVRGLVGGTSLSVVGFVVAPGPFNSYVADGILYENPIGMDTLGDVAPTVILVGALVALASALSTVVAVRQRFKAAVGEERQQMRWLAFVASFAGVCFVLQWVAGGIAEFIFGDEDAPIFMLFFGLTALSLVVGLPAAYLIAIFRHGLWDLDVVVKKTLQAGLLFAASIAVVGVVVSAVPVLFLGLDVDLLPALVTGVALAIGFNLVRSRARRWANRIVYGRRSTPYEVMSEFAERLGETYSTEDVLPRMVQLLGEATGARTARVWLRLGNELREEASWPAGAPEATSVPVRGDELPALGDEDAFEVRHQGELLGALTVSLTAADPMNPAKAKLARDMASQAGLVLRNVRLIEELRASRQRLVTAQDEERRKLERNIHDGAQQQLVALTVKLRLLEQLAEKDPSGARTMAVQIQEDTTTALDDLRDLARGIYPPLLADKGLPAALSAQARKSPVPVEVEADEIGRYSQDVEAAVYFSCLEALQNVAKYADASRVSISLTRTDGRLSFSVVDDGVGFDTASTHHGTGLQGMADRIDALGGTLEIRSSSGGGTSVQGTVPAGSGGR
jgi:signal transduction histidine kinase